jgi:hypothetical protein
MKLDDDDYGVIWTKIIRGGAPPQETLDAMASAVSRDDRSKVPHIWSLLSSDNELVRFYVLQHLVLDFKEKREAMLKDCWQVLESDPSEDVRGMAAACIGSILFGSCDRHAFEHLLQFLKSPSESPYVQGSVYDTLFQIAGLPPKEWPSHRRERQGTFDPTEVDWRRVAELQAAM